MTEPNEWYDKCKKHWEQIAKPIGSLGLFEDIVCQIGAIRNTDHPNIKQKAVLVFCGDHGVVSEGVTQTDSSVTRIVAENFAADKSTVNHFSNYAKADVFTFDIGMDTDCYDEEKIVKHAIINRKVKRGTNNLKVEAAMSIEDCKKALQIGEDAIRDLADTYDIFAIGEMGIGNTTPTAALCSYFLDLDEKQVTGKGAGLSKEGLSKKEAVVREAVLRVKAKNLTDPVEVLAELGGLEIAAMTGAFLGGAKYHRPVVVDGCICAVAAYVASLINPEVCNIAIASHCSKEPVGKLVLDELQKDAIIQGGMYLGEGTGAVMLFPLLDMVFSVYNSMGTFEDYHIDAYEVFEDKEGTSK